ncbi:hypothetical protein DOTSEDRAFT_19307 [Dothistroma septosporum NZE10]|uniref:Uncharacterized protein n=1 Tax=Dothistroma septosporum (strain NZE10 / CBS 128990) TaxID=675120 RepID=N1PZ39_DOTSN|nr:hypothetical protein DOTSEDRAFT_19307 [Dothistroma septosporum NZE10]
MYASTCLPQQSTSVQFRREHHRHRLPPSISGTEQVPMIEFRMGADEVLIGPIPWSAESEQWGRAVHREERVRSDSTLGLVYAGEIVEEDGERRRKLSELFELRVRKGEVVKKRKASRRLSEMVGFSGGCGSGKSGGKGVDRDAEKTGWIRRVSSIAWKKEKSPTRKEWAWPVAGQDDRREPKAHHIVPQDTARGINNYPYPGQASQYAWRSSHDAGTVSDRWTPSYSPAHSETGLLRSEPELFDQQENTQDLLQYLPQLERCGKVSQWQELQRASSNLILAHKTITPPHTISPATEMTLLHQRARRTLERVQQAFEEGRFSEENIARTLMTTEEVRRKLKQMQEITISALSQPTGTSLMKH